MAQSGEGAGERPGDPVRGSGSGGVWGGGPRYGVGTGVIFEEAEGGRDGEVPRQGKVGRDPEGLGGGNVPGPTR